MTLAGSDYSESMQHFRGIIWLAAILGVVSAAGLVAVRENDAAQSNAPPIEEVAPVEPVAEYHAIGSRTCASTACHGSVRPDPRSLGVAATHIRRDEYIFWSDHDPHARSLRTLETDRSQQMFAELGIKNAQGEIVDQRGYNNCLQCHATVYEDPITKTAAVESISCEACHGPAEAWRDMHYQRGWNPTVAARTGFADTKSLTNRANQCVQCHVGAADREVNHDLIAAGHPALKFELAAYHDMLPKHWNDAQERTRAGDFETQLWEAGQRQTMQQSLALLEARLARQDASHPQHEQALKSAMVEPVWPEFAEYDCFACHHELVEESWYRPAAKDPRQLAQWNTWSFALLDGPDSPPLAKLREAMNNSWRNPDEGLAASIQDARSLLSKSALADQRVSPDHAAVHWDSAAQAYLQLAATFRARQDEARKAGQEWPEEASIKQQLLKVRQLLAFKPKHDSPDATKGARDAVVEQLRLLEQQLSP